MPLHDPAHAFVPYPDTEVPHAGSGPLCGLSFAAKDLFDVAGYPTGGGSPFLLAMSGIKTRNAWAVQALLDAGARCVGKAVTDEFAYSMNGQNVHFGSPLNGAAPERIAGGSSSGSASAVAHRLCDFALGTDTGGSVRAPASHNGLVGLRPTHGRVSLAGSLDLAPSLDTCGWFTRDIHSFIRVGEVLLGPDSAPLPAAASGRVRLLRPADAWALVAPEVQEALAPGCAAAQALCGAATAVDVVLESFDAMYWHLRHIQGREAWVTHGALITRFAPPMGPGVSERFAWSSRVSDEQVAAALAFRAAFRRRLSDLLGDDGVLLLPTMPDIAPLAAAPEHTLEDYRNRAIRLLCIAGLSGFPQLSLPGATRLGAPLGLSLLGPAGSDRTLLAVARDIAAPGPH